MNGKLNKFTFTLLLLILLSCNKKTDHKKEYKPIDSRTLTAVNIDLEVLKNDSVSANDSLILFANQILEKYPLNLADVNEKIAHVFYAKSNLYLTKLFFEQSAKEYINDSLPIKYAEQLSNLGVLNELMGDYPKAIDNYYKALAIFNKHDLELESSFVYNNLGIVYQQLKNRDKSIELYKQSLLITNRINRLDLSASRYNNLATVYEELDAELDSALFYYNKGLALVLNDSVNDRVPIFEANIANIYIQKNELDKADSILKLALNYSKTNNISKGANTLNKYKAKLLLEQKDYIGATKYANKTLLIAQRNSYKKEELETLDILRQCFESQGEYEKSLKYLKDYNKLNQEILGIEKQKEINNLNIRFEVQNKNNKIKLLELEKNYINKRSKIFGYIGVFIVLSLVILIYTINLKRKHSNLLIKQMQRDVSDYINIIHDFEEEKHEQEENKHDLFLQKIKQFELTEREEEVLLYISKGYKNKEIANKMFVSINTIKTHIKNIFIKMDVRNRIEATNKAKV